MQNTNTGTPDSAPVRAVNSTVQLLKLMLLVYQINMIFTNKSNTNAAYFLGIKWRFATQITRIMYATSNSWKFNNFIEKNDVYVHYWTSSEK